MRSKVNATKIMGGSPAPRHAYPWMVMLRSHTIQSCGGTLINDRFILTAAHCLKNVKNENIDLIFGINDLNENYVNRSVINRIIPAQYDMKESTQPFDIALLEFSPPFTKMEPRINPICLPSESTNSFDNLKAIGWGIEGTTFFGSKSQQLKELDLEELSYQMALDY